MPLPADLLPATTDSPDATVALGRRLAAHLGPGEVVALDGDLGAGKTHLVKGLVAGRGGNPDAVTSPTFTLVHTYATPNGPVHHVDAYRIARPVDFAEIGGDDLLDDASALTVVEWPERIAPALPRGVVRLRLVHTGETTRRLERA